MPSTVSDTVPKLLSIAGTDPSGGAGVQADLKTFSALGGYGMTVVTSLVAQTTTGVAAVHPVPPEFVTTQLRTLLDDVRVDAVKIGMLGEARVVEAVTAALRAYRPPHVVLDPVMVAQSGDRLLDKDAVRAVRELLPLTDLVTPNLPEAAELLEEPEAEAADQIAGQAERLRRLGARGVLLKGGHLDGDDSPDLLFADGQREWLSAPRIATPHTHGTGCTLSSALAALRPRSANWATAARGAKEYLTDALRAADQLHVGHGRGPVHHFHALWS